MYIRVRQCCANTVYWFALLSMNCAVFQCSSAGGVTASLNFIWFLFGLFYFFVLLV